MAAKQQGERRGLDPGGSLVIFGSAKSKVNMSAKCGVLILLLLLLSPGSRVQVDIAKSLCMVRLNFNPQAVSDSSPASLLFHSTPTIFQAPFGRQRSQKQPDVDGGCDRSVSASHSGLLAQSTAGYISTSSSLDLPARSAIRPDRVSSI